jgi:hypothetical protein
LINVPILGEITVLPKFMVPVRKAKVVPSIFLGVILAKRAMTGRVYRSVEIIEEKTSVNKRNTISFIPHSTFHLLAKHKFRKPKKISTSKEIKTMVLVSTFLQKAL